jgi:hypothetical protein
MASNNNAVVAGCPYGKNGGDCTERSIEGTHAVRITTKPKGKGEKVTTMQPSLVLKYIIKY